MGDYIQHARPQFATTQLLESHLRDIEASPGTVDGCDMDRLVVCSVSYFPARAAVGGVPHNVESAADKREGGKIAERRVSRYETVFPI